MGCLGGSVLFGSRKRNSVNYSCKKRKSKPEEQVSERSETLDDTSRNLGNSLIRALLLDAYQTAKAIFVSFSKKNKSETAAAFGITV